MDNRKTCGVSIFNYDIKTNKGYLYTTGSPLGSYLANRRLTDAVLEIIDFSRKRVLDLGCGDGTYTLELFVRGHPASIKGVDLADEAVKVAQKKIDSHQVTFEVNSGDELPYESNSFDIVHIRGVLHHMDRPIDGLREALRVASVVVLLEPNGYNPALKLLERFSSYHIKHNEKSYTLMELKRWVSQLGGRIYYRKYVGFVPCFCPDWLAKLLKWVEPLIERIPGINSLLCSDYVLVIKRTDSEPPP